MSLLKTFIKRSGNKSRYLKHIVPLLPPLDDIDTYIEPFVGSGSLFLHLQPPKWIINDIDADIINLWKTVASSTTIIHKTIQQFSQVFLPLDRDARLVMCRTLTTKLEKLDFTQKRAALFVILTYTVFMGMLIRNNKFYFRGLDLSLNKQNVHFMSDKYRMNLDRVNAFLQNTNGRILNQDYKKILAKAKRRDFVFLDPPYIETLDYDFDYTTGGHAPYHGISHDTNFLQDLKREIDNLNKRGVRFLMTQADTPKVVQLFKNYKIARFKVYRRRTDTYRHELIVYNY